MDYKFFLGIGVAVAIIFAGAAVYTGLVKQASVNSPERDTLYQVSTIDALMQGVYTTAMSRSGILKNTATLGSAPSTSLMAR